MSKWKLAHQCFVRAASARVFGSTEVTGLTKECLEMMSRDVVEKKGILDSSQEKEKPVVVPTDPLSDEATWRSEHVRLRGEEMAIIAEMESAEAEAKVNVGAMGVTSSKAKVPKKSVMPPKPKVATPSKLKQPQVVAPTKKFPAVVTPKAPASKIAVASPRAGPSRLLQPSKVSKIAMPGSAGSLGGPKNRLRRVPGVDGHRA
jgi:hypothetical protein